MGAKLAPASADVNVRKGGARGDSALEIDGANEAVGL
jgi:hypothetical protein